MKYIPLLTAILTIWTARANSQDPPSPTVETLIEQLGSRSFAERERSTRQLRDRGPAALPALRKALESKDEEVRKRAESLIPALEIDEALLPKRVTLKADNRAIGDVLKDLEKQTGYKLAMGNDSTRKVSADYRDTPFWEVLDRVAADASQVVSFESYQMTLRLQPTPSRSPYVNLRGPFRLEATWFHEDRDVDLTSSSAGKETGRNHRLTLAVSILAEPRITFLKIGPAKVEEALDSDGKSLVETGTSPVANGNQRLGRGSFRGEFLHSSDIRLRRAGESAKTLKIVRGTIPVNVILIRRPVVVTSKVLESTGTRFRAGNDGLEITRVTNQGGGSLEIQFLVPYRNNSEWQWQQRFHVEDDAGNRFQNNGHGSSSDGKQQWISGYYSPPFNKKNVGPPTKLILEDWVIHDHSIPFEFKDVPMP